ncbi:hypothetical protein CYMTET_33111, partial [Cymbomonas tetramitiformis]
MEAGADLSHADNDGKTPAHVAAGKEHAEALLRVLKEAGADLSHAAIDGSTPTHVAAKGGNSEALRVLQEAGADLSHADNEGKTPAHVAAEKGAEVDAEDVRAARPTVALAFGRRLRLGAPEARAGVNAGTGQRPLHAAAERGLVEMVRELVGKGAEVDAEDGEGRTALTVALAFGQEAAARALLEAGAGVNAGTGRRPLHVAAEKGKVEMLIELAGKGAEVDAEDREGRTALMVALAFGQEGAARALLEAGAGVNAGTGQRPLHAAAKRGMEEMVRELLKK